MNKDNKWELLAKYLSEKTTEEENKVVQDWLAVDNKNRELFLALSRVWDDPDYSSNPNQNHEFCEVLKLRPVFNTFEKSAKSSGSGRIRKNHFLKEYFISKRYMLIKYFILFILILLIPYLYVNQLNSSNADFNLSQRFSVPLCEQKGLSLSDGSRVMLDAGSTLFYPKSFSANKREVKIIGSGYFEVESKDGRPFIVHANRSTIEVTGTTFCINTWQEGTVTVSVIEGEVLFFHENSKNDKVLVEAGYKSQITKNRKPSVPEAEDIFHALSWMNGEINYQDVPLSIVINQFERWYKKRIVLGESESTKKMITFNLTNKSLDDNINRLTSLIRAGYEFIGDTILISESKN